MATNFLSSDVYEITQLIEDIKSRNITGVDSLTLAMSIFGYFSEISSAMMQSAVVMASEYSNEAIPVKAKFEKNVITHALTLGIEGLNAQPAEVTVTMFFPEDILVANMINDVFTLDKDMAINIDKFEYHLDYDAKIYRSKLPSGEYVYTAMYEINRKNPISDITNPYLPPIARVTNSSNVPMIGVTVTLHQVEYNKVYKKILSTNPLESKIINFTFESQLAAFDVDVEENSETYHLTPVYDGLVDQTTDLYCYYNYMNTNSIRLKFNSDVYQPTLNADVTVNIYTTQGSAANFTYKDNSFVFFFESERFRYDRLYAQIAVISDSANGIDRKSIDEIKKLIPPAALARGSVTNETDLNNYFNQVNTDDIKLLFFEKIDNVLMKRLYYSFLLMRMNNVIVPMNTIPVDMIRSNFNSMNNQNYVFNVGNMIYYTGNKNGTVRTGVDSEELKELEESGFVYMNPFVCVINRSPFYVSYFLTIMDLYKFLNFDYVNQKSQIQFIASSITWKRELFTDRDTYKLNVSLSQNIMNDMNILIRDDEDNIVDIKAKVALVLYDEEGNPYRYKFAQFKEFHMDGYVADFEVTLKTDDMIDDTTNRIQILDMMDIGTVTESYGFFEKKTTAKLFVYVQNQDGAAAGRGDADKIIPDMQDYALCNIYEVYDGIDFFYNYSHIIDSAVKVTKQDDTSLLYTIDKMPVIRYSYIDSEQKFQEFLTELEMRRLYIENCLEVLDDSFGIDLKFFNTYGPSKLFAVTDDYSRLDRVNITLKFRCKLATISDRYIEEDMIQFIKDYVEDINEGIANLHIPNLITEVTNQFREQVVFFEFLEINDYGPGYQHIYRPDESLIAKIPEFLCINTAEDGTPDIQIEFV